MNYTEHYMKAKEKFHRIDCNLDLHKIDYMDLVDSDVEKLSNKVALFFKNKKGKLSIPYTDSIFDLNLNAIANTHVPHVENNIFGCNLFVDKVYIYRNTRAPKAESSWLWHYDNNPKEVFKIMVYLTDVDETKAPFQYVKNHLKTPTKIGPKNWKPAPNNSRVPKEKIDSSQIATVTGKAGKTFIFNPNCVHRATIPKEGFRDVLILRVRPCFQSVASEGYVNSKWTTSWESDGAVPKDPAIMKQAKKRK